MNGISIRLLRSGDDAVLSNVAADVFDEDVDHALTREFLADPRHHIFVALDGDLVVGMATGMHHIHPDKPVEFWVNEVGVAPSHQRRGIATALIKALFAHGRSLGAKIAWLGTERSNVEAMALYAGLGGREVAPDPVNLDFDLSDPKTG